MTRLFLALLLVAAAALALQALASLARTGAGLLRGSGAGSRPREETAVPDSFRNIAYALLIVLMFGVTTGWLGGG